MVYGSDRGRRRRCLKGILSLRVKKLSKETKSKNEMEAKKRERNSLEMESHISSIRVARKA